ncbi:MAG: hydroxymethylglutaryl-CoA synthase [Candidatus Aenigmatarchaeota archaeon]
MNKVVGIDALAAYVPKTFLELVPEKKVDGKYVETEFCKSRRLAPAFEKCGDLPSYIADGVGVYQFGVPDGHEDSVTMGAMAFKKLIDDNDLNISDIGRVFVGTETPVDNSKPNAIYINGAIERHFGGSMRNCTPVDMKFACAGATVALELLGEWIESGKSKGRYGVAIATDISTYPLRTREEVTQGAGAIAMLVSENPRLLAFENGSEEITSTVSKDEKDFFRPVTQHTAVVDGQLSIGSYLSTCKEALLDYRNKAVSQGIIAAGGLLTDNVDRLLLHLPFYKMGEYASSALFKNEWRGTSRFDEIVKEIGFPEPKNGDKVKEKDFEKKFRESKIFKEAFSQKVESGLLASRRTGNIYTGSIYASLMSMLENDARKGTDLNGKRFGFGSYGSGSLFKAFTARIQPEFKEVVSKMDLLKQLDERNSKGSLSLDDYERLHEKGMVKSDSIIEPHQEFVLDRIGNTSLDSGYRYYRFVD